MAGKLCYGATKNNSGAGTLRESIAFADGIKFRASGTGLQAPLTGNPHAAGSEASAAWALGWGIANIAAGSSLGAIGCAAPTGIILA